MARNKWWFAAGAALLLMIVALLMERPASQPPQQEAASIRSGVTTMPFRPTVLVGSPSSGMEGSPAPNAAPETGRYELCGFGKAPPQITSGALNEYVFALTQKTDDRWNSALLDSSDLRARAMGLLLGHAESRFHSPGKTGETEEKPPEEISSEEKPSEGMREELVQLAAGGADPVVYAAATWICESGTTHASQTEACRRISLRGWARVDPDNAMPWLEVAMEDRTRGDSQAEAIDFARAAAAHKSDFYQDPLLRAAFAEVPPDAAPLAKVAGGIKYVGILSAQPLLEMSEASRFCSVEELHWPDRRTSCESLAQLWVSHGSSVLELNMGKALGRRLGWPEQRLSRLDQELKAMMSLVREDANDPWSCQSVASDIRFLEGRAHEGELNFLREMLERSSPATESLATPESLASPEPSKP